MAKNESLSEWAKALVAKYGDKIWDVDSPAVAAMDLKSQDMSIDNIGMDVGIALARVQSAVKVMSERK